MTEIGDFERQGAGQTRLGLRHGIVRLSPHDLHWAELYRVEELAIRAAVGPRLLAIEHYGSTAVPGILAKPILDILAAVERIEDALACHAELQAIGYEFRPDAGVPDHHVFGKGMPRTHLLHLVEHGSPEWVENLRFRDALRSDLALAREYESLKVSLARQFPENRAAYTEAKTEFIRRIRGTDRGRSVRSL